MLSKLDNLRRSLLIWQRIDCGFHYTAGSIRVLKTSISVQFFSSIPHVEGHAPLHCRDVKAFGKHIHSLKPLECRFSIASCRHMLWRASIFCISITSDFFSYTFLLITTSGSSWMVLSDLGQLMWLPEPGIDSVWILLVHCILLTKVN